MKSFVISSVSVPHGPSASPTRKRKYAQCRDQPFMSDFVVEVIEKHPRTSLFHPEFRVEQCLTHMENDTDSPTDRAAPLAQIHNLVGTARIDLHSVELDLPSISMFMPNGIFDRQKFAAITVRLHNPKCTVLLFSSGKMVLTGCKTFLQCLCASHDIANLVKQAYPNISLRLGGVSIQNIVGNADLNLADDERIDLDAIMEDHNVYCTYLKHMFPGLIFRPPNSPVVLLLFLSGKVVITGGKSSHDVYYGWKRLWPTVRQYIKKKITF